jgi:hypothetical protein
MNALVISIAVVAHLLIPPLLLMWMFKAKVTSKLQWFALVGLVGAYIVLMWAGGAGWGWFGYYWPYLFLLGFIVITGVSSRQLTNHPWFPPRTISAWLGSVLLASVALLIGIGLPSALSARSYPKDNVIHLLFPLRGGTFHIGHGGSNETMNQHFPVSAQRFALDIEKLNGFGIRAMGFVPEELSQYAIYGSDVLAPCSGEVLANEISLPDLTPPNGDQDNLLGNHVIIFCKNSSVLLAHLKPNSVQVKVGDVVHEGSVVGQVGNTGNTSEPHLHIHAVAGKYFSRRAIAGTAEGIPMLFDGKFLIRNDRVTNP